MVLLSTLQSDVLIAIAPTLAVVVGWLLTKNRLQEIHVLVNARLDNVTEQLRDLQDKRDEEADRAKEVVLEAAKHHMQREVDTTKQATDVVVEAAKRQLHVEDTPL